MINKETIDNIFETARVEEVVGDFIHLKKRGVNMIGLCPFHDEKTPSFTVSPTKGIYKCFGCGKGGNSVNFIMEHEQMTYPEALKFLAKKYNIEIEEQEQTPEQLEAQNERESLYIVTSFANDFFVDRMHNSEEGKAIGLGYFKERGFTEETIEKFELGYSPDEWDALTNAALEKGYNIDYLEKCGLSIVKGEKKFDRFKGRVIFPIHNLSGRVIAFGGRTLKQDKKAAKYVNSPESEIYHKSNVLYGAWFAKKAIIAEDNCYLVEGYTDVISMHQAGVENVVASSGTSLTIEQIKLIKRYSNNITILYDGDPAGIKASFRGIDLILQEGMNVRVLLFPDGQDPDSYAKSVDREELKEFINANSSDFIRFKTGILLKDAQGDPIKKAGLVREIVESIAIVPDGITRSLYLKECSRLMEIDEQVLINEHNKVRRKKFSEKLREKIPEELEEPLNLAQDQEELVEHTTVHQEKDIIRLLLNYGEEEIIFEEEDEEVKMKVAEFIVNEMLSDGLTFEHSGYQGILDIYTECLNNEEIPSNQTLINHTDPKINSLAVDMLSSPYSLSENWEKHGIYVETEKMLLKKAVVNSVYSLKSSMIQQMILNKEEELKRTDSEDDKMIILQEVQVLNETKKVISKQLGRVII